MVKEEAEVGDRDSQGRRYLIETSALSHSLPLCNGEIRSIPSHTKRGRQQMADLVDNEVGD